MSRNITKKNELTPQQTQAIDLLLTGQSVTDTAAAVGVERETLSRWKNHDAAFMSALTYRQQAIWDESADKLRLVLLKAADRLAQLVDHEDPAVAVRAIAAVYKASAVYPHNGRVDGKSVHSIERAQLFDLL